jgi:hypothetical protein
MTVEVIWTLVQVLLIPAFAAMWWCIYKLFTKITEQAKEITKSEANAMAAVAKAKEEGAAAVAAVRLHVAENYASTAYLKDVEARLVNQLDRIEKKLDAKGNGAD